jgi:bacterioferritin
MVEAIIMKGDARIIELLNEVLTSELTAINQYFIHYKMLENWGYKRLAHVKKKESIEEMHHADEVISRILYLDGVPNMQRLSPIKVGETVKEIHESDLSLEQTAVERLNRAVLVSTQVGDNGSRILFEKILKEEEDAIDWLETHLSMLAQLGETAYLAEMIGEVE